MPAARRLDAASWSIAAGIEARTATGFSVCAAAAKMAVR
jgi:hypothetical protein